MTGAAGVDSSAPAAPPFCPGGPDRPWGPGK